MYSSDVTGKKRGSALIHRQRPQCWSCSHTCPWLAVSFCSAFKRMNDLITDAKPILVAIWGMEPVRTWTTILKNRGKQVRWQFAGRHRMRGTRGYAFQYNPWLRASADPEE